MYRRNYDELSQVSIGSEIIYVDELSGKKNSGIIGFIEDMGEDLQVAFVYIISPYKDENVNVCEYNGINYKDIMVFDNVPNSMHGWHRDSIYGTFGKYAGKE